MENWFSSLPRPVSRRRRLTRWASACLLGGLLLAGCGRTPPPPPGSGYSPVTGENLLASPFSHRTGQERFEFTWIFEPGRFVIEGERIPPDLTDALLGAGQVATRVEGKWSIHNGLIQLRVPATDLSAGERGVEWPIFSTGVIRIQTPDAQYVF